MNKKVYIARTDKNSSRSQLLSEHLLEVSRLMRQTCEDIGLSSMGMLSGLIHDLGKAQAEWQAYLLDTDFRKTVSHAPIAAQWFWSRYGKKSGYYDLAVAEIITLVIYSHHAGLPDIVSPNGQKMFFTALVSENQSLEFFDGAERFINDLVGLEKIDKLYSEAVSEWMGLCERITNGLPQNTSTATKDNYIMMLMGLVMRHLYACLIDADRLDAACWEDNRKTEVEPYNPDVWEKLTEIFETNLDKRSQEEAAHAASGVHNLRRSISEQCRISAARKSGIYRLYAPTGSGKCFSSLRYALNHANEHNKKRILFVIPFISVLEQNAKDIREILGNPETLILEHHSNIIIDKEDNEDSATKTNRLLTERWDCPVIITTLVQLLNSLFLGRSQSVRRMQALSDAVIVIDEVQALPAHCISLFNVGITFLSTVCNSTVLLCTATQPTLAETSYPLRLDYPSDLVPDYERAFYEFRRTHTKNLCRPGGHTCAEIAEIAARQCAEQGSVLVVMNTKSGVKKVYGTLAAMETGARLYYLTTELCPMHRLKVIEDIRRDLDIKPSVPIIVVSTSLVEFGMNLSFGCAIRALAGLDSLVQVSGRCNRHGESAQRPVILLRSSEENTGCLPELVRASICTEKVLRDLEGNEQDLLSPEAIGMYYRYYFRESERVMDYAVKSPALTGQTLCDYLGANSQAFWESGTQELPMLPHQSFRTAGDIFCVIKDNTTGIIVPWGEGETIITELSGAVSIGEKKKLLRRAQPYTVSVYQNKLIALQDSKAIFPIKEVDAFALRPEFYNDVYGVSLTPHFNADNNIV